MNHLSKRLESFDSSKIRAAFELAEAIPNQIDLSIGFPEGKTPRYVKRAAIAAIRNDQTYYTPSGGLPELRRAAARKFAAENGIDADAERVSVTPGLTTAILLCYLALLDPGDEVLLPDPYFPPYRDLALMTGAKLKMIDTAPAFQLTAELIEPLLTPKSKLLVINSPNNPTGAIYPKNELLKIAQLAKKHDLIIISDEIYEYFVYDGRHFSIGSAYENTLTLNGFSKAYAMTGWRIGYISGPRDIINAIDELQQYIVFSSSSIGQYAALAALRRQPAKLSRRYRAKRDLALKTLSPVFPDIRGAQGAFYLFLKLPSGIDDVGFVNHLSHRGVLTLPGGAFSKHADYIRVSYGGETKNLKKGLELVRESVEILQHPKAKATGRKR